LKLKLNSEIPEIPVAGYILIKIVNIIKKLVYHLLMKILKMETFMMKKMYLVR